jgi:hypothetical protein
MAMVSAPEVSRWGINIGSFIDRIPLYLGFLLKVYARECNFSIVNGNLLLSMPCA